MAKTIFSKIKQGSSALEKKRLKWKQDFSDDRISQKKIKHERTALEKDEIQQTLI